MSRSVFLYKCREWVVRYYPAEIIGTACAVAGAFVVHHITHSLAVAAVAGSVAETIGFYSYFAYRDGVGHYSRHTRRPYWLRAALTAYHTARGMLIEFGPAELLDSIVVRPFCMYAGPVITGNFAVGLIGGKLAADIVFYSVAAIGYELKKRMGRLAVAAPETESK